MNALPAMVGVTTSVLTALVVTNVRVEMDITLL